MNATDGSVLRIAFNTEEALEVLRSASKDISIVREDVLFIKAEEKCVKLANGPTNGLQCLVMTTIFLKNQHIAGSSLQVDSITQYVFSMRLRSRVQVCCARWQWRTALSLSLLSPCPLYLYHLYLYLLSISIIFLEAISLLLCVPKNVSRLPNLTYWHKVSGVESSL